MRIAYFDCFSGISGNMCLGALIDAGVPAERMQQFLLSLPIEGYGFHAERVRRGGIAATHVEIELRRHEHSAHHHTPHRGLSDVLAVIESADLPARAAEWSRSVFHELAEAEAAVHDTDVESVHFHEVGAVDAICDIVGTAWGLHELGVEQVLFSAVSLGGGTVVAAHGSLPVPAPATARLLREVPTVGGPVAMELTTPTGAAILKALGRAQPTWPAMSVEAIGYGAGSRDPEAIPNVLRLAIGQTAAQAGTEADVVWALEANVDDMSGEETGYAVEKLMEGEALEVFLTPVQMKKNRPGVQITVLCEPSHLRTVEELLWTHTSTLGVRRCLWQRSKLARRRCSVETPWGNVAVKLSLRGGRVVGAAPEYEDCRRLADRHDLALRRVYTAALEALPAGSRPTVL